jgi:hypothetical protein
MFVGDEVLLEMSFAVAWSRLDGLAERGLLGGAAQDAYGREVTGCITRAGPPGGSELVRVQVRALAETAGSAGLAIRWEATGAGGGLFPVLDADIRLAAAGDNLTLLTLAGVYRPPLAALGELLDRAALHRAAAATIRNFLSRVAADITGRSWPARAAAAGAGPSLPPAGPG